MKFLKKNQVIVAVIGVMLIAAGYLNFTNKEESETEIVEAGALADSEQMAGIGDATLVSTTPTESNIIENQVTENNVAEDENEYYTKSRLERETMYSKRIESYQEMLDKANISEAQRGTAQKEITKIGEEQNAIMITENLMKTKGFKDIIIFVNGESINVVVKTKELKPEQIAQIQNMITREFKAKIENIHITEKE